MNGYACNTCKQVHNVGEICPVPIHKTKKNFELFLMDEFLKDFHGTKDQSIDAFDAWIENLEIDEWLAYGDKYAQTFKLTY